MIYSSVLIGFLLYFLGFVTYAYFSNCDPLLAGRISERDQILPYMVVRIFSQLPGLSGLFIAGVFSAALSVFAILGYIYWVVSPLSRRYLCTQVVWLVSKEFLRWRTYQIVTVSSALNAMSSVTIGDLIRPNVQWSENTFLWLSKGLTFLYGGLCIGFAFVSSVLGGVIQASLSLLGICAGPLLGAVVIGSLFPFANESGAILGMTAALSFNIWLFAGSWVNPPPSKFLGLKTTTLEGCENTIINTNSTTPEINFQTTSLLHVTLEADLSERPPIADFYAVSFAYYSPIGLMVCIIVGLLVSCATGGCQTRNEVDPRLIYLPFEHKLLRWLPKKFREFMKPEMGVAKSLDFDSNEDENEYKLRSKANHQNEEVGNINEGYCNDEKTTYL